MREIEVSEVRRKEEESKRDPIWKLPIRTGK